MYHQKLVYHKAKLLAVAPSYEKTKLSQLTAQDNVNMRRDSDELMPIPGAFDEVNGVHRVFGGKTLMRKRATEKRFKEIAGQYDILHLATHGIINNEYPMFSKLVFAPGKDSVNDGFLNTYEIYNMQINAPLVVLSACNTGYGKLHKGEGIISLSRGFFTAGAKSIVMTLWSIGDKTSSMLMHNFYTNLAANQNIGDAMQKAKLDYLEQTDEMKAHPYFWAGYIVLGNTEATFEPDKPKTWFYPWIIIGMLVIAGIMFRKRIRRILTTGI
jgi:CHAT domain-containing protein